MQGNRAEQIRRPSSLQRVIQVSIFSRRAKLLAPTLSSGDYTACHFVGPRSRMP
jgi:hypothetical protein